VQVAQEEHIGKLKAHISALEAQISMLQSLGAHVRAERPAAFTACLLQSRRICVSA
jgi:hypothetical protein